MQGSARTAPAQWRREGWRQRRLRSASQKWSQCSSGAAAGSRSSASRAGRSTCSARSAGSAASCATGSRRSALLPVAFSVCDRGSLDVSRQIQKSKLIAQLRGASASGRRPSCNWSVPRACCCRRSCSLNQRAGVAPLQAPRPKQPAMPESGNRTNRGGQPRRGRHGPSRVSPPGWLLGPP